MAREGKDQRRVAATQAEMGRVLKRLYSLSVTMMRVDAAWEAYHAEMTKVITSGKSEGRQVGRAWIARCASVLTECGCLSPDRIWGG